MTHVATFLLSLVGFAALLLAMPRHQQDWFGRKLAPPSARALHLSGFAALALALFIAGIGLGWSYGVVAWLGWLTIAATLAVTANTNRARILCLAGKERP